FAEAAFAGAQPAKHAVSFAHSRLRTGPGADHVPEGLQELIGHGEPAAQATRMLALAVRPGNAMRQVYDRGAAVGDGVPAHRPAQARASALGDVNAASIVA